MSQTDRQPNMRKFLFTLACFLTLLFVGCTADSPSTDLPAVEDGPTILTLSTTPSRTSLGDKVGDGYPVYWSEGDKIAVNGILSQEAVINSQNGAEAKFTIDGKLSYPLNITYPYTSTTTATAPKVVIPTTQNYTEGSFERESAPMCGYTTNKTQAVAMKHLVGVLKFPVINNQTNTVILDRIVITSIDGAKISGEFEVNCSTGSIKACENSSNSITYTLPENFALSPDKASNFFVSTASGDLGNCIVEFIEKSGEKMTSQWNGKDVKAGVVKEFKTITYKRGMSVVLAPMGIDKDSFLIFYTTVEGHVKDSNGKPISGVAVSDGFSVVATNSQGYYKLDNVSKDTHYIYISIPAEYEVPTNEFGQPCFYKPYPDSSNIYNFTLTPLSGGKEEKFALFTFADPQVSKTTTLNRLLNEAVPEIYKHSQSLKSQGIPCYGITLGDIISNGDGTNSGAFRDDLRDAFAISSVGMPVFQVMGNHDNTYFNASNPLFTDERHSSFELKAQREHEDMFGPANYSFNRGNVHIVGMRDIVYRVNHTSGSYQGGFLPSQFEWLKQDLALVPKDKMVVLCVHIQLFNGTSNYIQEVLSLLDEYKEAHILSGHTHRQQLYDHKTKSDSSHKVYEHNTCAVCGSWWSANIAGDGTPNGYNVFIGKDNTFSDWYYMGYSRGMNARSHQMRLYRGNAVTGGKVEGTNTYGIKGYYAFNYADDVLLANVYNADSEWKIEVYEDGVYSGDMTQASTSTPSFSALIGDYSYDNPRRAGESVNTGTDFYATGLHLGVLGRWSSSKNAPGNGAYNTCWHMYQYKLKNKNAKIKVVAIDRFNNHYTETVITDGTDYSLVKKPE